MPRAMTSSARFDLADQAYAQAIRLGGETVRVLNDQGYSYMLRGNLAGARRKFEKAYSLDPGNPVIANNLELLDGCPSSDNLRLIRLFAKRGSGSSGVGV